MDSDLYSVLTTCPICEKSFNVIKVKSTVVRLESVDEDFCMHYKTINPLLYEPWICEHCGYAGFGSGSEGMSGSVIAAMKKLCLIKFTDDPTKNPFELTDFHKLVDAYLDSLGKEGERDYFAALKAFEITLFNLEAQKAPSSSKAKTLLRIGWIYRLMKDPQELEYLQKAADCFADTYQVETLPIGKFDYATCAFLIGELNRRTGNLTVAMEWFDRVIRLPKSTETSIIVDKTRDQIQVIKSSPAYALLK